MPEEGIEIITVTEPNVTDIHADQVEAQVEVIGMYKDHGKFIETDTLIIPKKSEDDKDDGIYVAYFKTSAIPVMPKYQFERAKMFQQAVEDADKSILRLKKFFKKRALKLNSKT